MRIIWLASLSNSSLLANGRKRVQYRHSDLPFVLFESGATQTPKPLVNRSILPLMVLSQENKMEHQGKFSFLNSRAPGMSLGAKSWQGPKYHSQRTPSSIPMHTD